ncbi:MAG: phosphonate metabolism protein/1,5-bisphosphokinase (PRPP-forming) PhnN [Desulfovibrio sp.]|jgi:ribose 1,5-bisphosphokinase|nr:phosphonate metabolism protein/1,5-bisphosphokinase (PRPP-forming) PhnN [Desulfovibrio sp.]
MSGKLVYVMGPSGAGKDTLLRGVSRELSRNSRQAVVFMRRYITRPADSGGERHHPLSREEFLRRAEADFFALSWESHGLFYGIGKELDEVLSTGATAVVSASRVYLPKALRRYPGLIPILITAREELLRERLRTRAREDAAGIEERLSSAGMKMDGASGLITIDNSGRIETAQDCFMEVLRRVQILSPFDGANSTARKNIENRHAIEQKP